jgi:hypothetical protein
MNERSQDEADADFVLERVEHFITMDARALMDHFRVHPEDAFSEIPNPLGKRQIYVGKVAYDRLASLAERYLARHPQQASRISFGSYFEAVKRVYSQYFLLRGQGTSWTAVRRMLSEAYDTVAKNFEQLTHYVPCTLVAVNEPKEFQLGPIRFFGSSHFWDLHGKQVAERPDAVLQDQFARKLVSANPRDDSLSLFLPVRQSREYLTNSLREFFARYDWVASITIPACDSEVSSAKAELVVERGLDFLKLMRGRENSNRFSSAYGRDRVNQSDHLRRDSNGHMEIWFSRSSKGNLANPDWFSNILTSGGLYLTAAEKALHASLLWPRREQIADRFFDALDWYGKAVAEDSPALTLVNCVLALERLTITQRKREVSRILCRRVGLLCYDPPIQNLFPWLERIESLYDWRSALVHGARSQMDSRVKDIAREAERVTRIALLRGLLIFDRVGAFDRHAAQGDIEREFRKLEANAFLNGWPWN